MAIWIKTTKLFYRCQLGCASGQARSTSSLRSGLRAYSNNVGSALPRAKAAKTLSQGSSNCCQPTSCNFSAAFSRAALTACIAIAITPSCVRLTAVARQWQTSQHEVLHCRTLALAWLRKVPCLRYGLAEASIGTRASTSLPWLSG